MFETVSGRIVWLWIIYCIYILTLRFFFHKIWAVQAVYSNIQAYLQHFFGLIDPCTLNSTIKLPADASFQPDKQCELGVCDIYRLR